MSETEEVVVVKGVRISKSEYDRDPKKYGKPDSEAKQAEADLPRNEVSTLTQAPTPTPAPSAPIMGDQHPMGNVPTGQGGPMGEGDGERRVVLSDPMPPAGEAEQLQVAKMGTKYFVLDSKGEKVERDGIEAGGYRTEAEAFKAINPAADDKTTGKDGQAQ